MRLLGKINVQGMAKRVLLAQSGETDGALDDTDHASHEEESGRIYLNADRNTEPSRVRENVIHELTHAWLESSGARYYLRGMCGLKGEAWDEVEENLVRMLSPAISSSLSDMWKVLGSLSHLSSLLRRKARK